MANFDGKMGALMWLGNAIHTALQNARTKKEINQIYKNVSEANFQNRAVAVLSSVNKKELLLISGDPSDNDIIDMAPKSKTPAIDYIWGINQSPQSAVVSGGPSDARVRALMPFVRKSQNKNIPLIALHNGNRNLEAMITQNSLDCECISRNKFYYDIFRGMAVDDMAFLLYETMPDDNNKPKSPKAEALLRALLEVVLRKNSTVTFQNLAAFPLANLKDILDGMAKKAYVTVSEYKAIDRDYMAGSSELDEVRVFLNKLNRQAAAIYGNPTENTCNIKKMLNRKGAIAIDVGGVQNDLIFSLVTNHLMLLQSQGRDFSILLDDVPISRYPKATDLIRGRTYAISHNDFVASLFGGKKQGNDLFSEITGNVSTLVLLGHASGTSCQKWSEHLGKYHKIRIRYNISQSKAFLNSSDSRGISVDETDEPRVRAETLSRLPGTLACIHNSEGTLFAEV
ncbi:MAG: hypothetical protein LBE31_07455 [Deltaproteobacteria bacterium]|jgi:hypothetical protein|nr:hypothetical protein [Deltaproteobacteria bacterium]